MVVLSCKVKFTSGIGYEHACLSECGKDVWSLKRRLKLANWKHIILIGELVLPIRYCVQAKMAQELKQLFLDKKSRTTDLSNVGQFCRFDH